MSRSKPTERKVEGRHWSERGRQTKITDKDGLGVRTNNLLDQYTILNTLWESLKDSNCKWTSL